MLSQTKRNGFVEYFCEGGKEALDNSKLYFGGGKRVLDDFKGFLKKRKKGA